MLEDQRLLSGRAISCGLHLRRVPLLIALARCLRAIRRQLLRP